MSDTKQLKRSTLRDTISKYHFKADFEKEPDPEAQIILNTRAVLKTLLIEHRKDCNACKTQEKHLVGAIEFINDVDIVD